MRADPRSIGKTIRRALGWFGLAVFLQWMGLPNNWPSPPGTVYEYIADLVGMGSSGGHAG
jgi:hypothetical protein